MTPEDCARCRPNMGQQILAAKPGRPTPEDCERCRPNISSKPAAPAPRRNEPQRLLEAPSTFPKRGSQRGSLIVLPTQPLQQRLPSSRPKTSGAMPRTLPHPQADFGKHLVATLVASPRVARPPRTLTQQLQAQEPSTSSPRHGTGETERNDATLSSSRGQPCHHAAV